MTRHFNHPANQPLFAEPPSLAHNKMKRGGRFRLLPITLGAVALLLALKMTHVVNGFNDLGRAMAMSRAEAQTSVDAAKHPDTTNGKVQLATAELPRDPTRFTQSEIDLLQALSARRDELDKHDKEIGEREVLLEAAQKRLDEKLASIEGMKGELLSLINKRSDADDARLRSLVKIYEAMKPKEASQIFEKLDMDVLIGVIERMKEAKVAPILADMNPDRAKTVTALLAERKTVQVGN